MKILFVVGWYYPAAVGGVARITHTYASHLARLGHDVEVWTSDYLNGRVRPVIREERSEVIVDRVKVRYHRSFFLGYQAKTKRVISPALVRNCRSRSLNDFDIVHIPESRALHTCACFLGLPSRTRPVFVHSAFGALGGESWGVMKRLYDRVFLRRFFRQNMKLFLAQTAHEVDVYRRFLSEKQHSQIRVLPLCTDTTSNRAKAAKFKGALHSLLNVDPSAKIVLFLGRLTPNKGIVELVRGFRLMQGQGSYHLVIVGYDEGALEGIAELVSEQDLKGKVTILPSCHGDERFGYYADASVFAITSTFFEETSLASLEALSVGTPCVVSHQTEIPYLEHYNAGRQVEPVPVRIAAALDDVGGRAEKLRENAIRLSDDKFNENNVVRSLERLYQEALLSCGAH